MIRHLIVIAWVSQMTTWAGVPAILEKLPPKAASVAKVTCSPDDICWVFYPVAASKKDIPAYKKGEWQ